MPAACSSCAAKASEYGSKPALAHPVDPRLRRLICPSSLIQHLSNEPDVANSGEVGEFCRPYMPVPSKAMRAMTLSKGLQYKETSFQQMSSSARFIQNVSVSERQRAILMKSWRVVSPSSRMSRSMETRCLAI